MWHSDINKLCKKVASAIAAMKRAKPFVPKSTLLNIYNSLLQSHFDYCSLVWGNYGKTLSNKLKKLQNSAAHERTSSNYVCYLNSAKPLAKSLRNLPREILRSEQGPKYEFNRVTPFRMEWRNGEIFYNAECLVV